MGERLQNRWQDTRWGKCPICGHKDWCAYTTMTDGSLTLYCWRFRGFGVSAKEHKLQVVADNGDVLVYIKETPQGACMFQLLEDYNAFCRANGKSAQSRMSEADYYAKTKSLYADEKQRKMLSEKEQEEIVEHVSETYFHLLNSLVLEDCDRRSLLKKDKWSEEMLRNFLHSYGICSLPPEDTVRFDKDNPRYEEYQEYRNPYRKKLCKQLEDAGCVTKKVPGFYQSEKDHVTRLCGQQGILLPCFDQLGRIYRLRLRVDDAAIRMQVDAEMRKLDKETYSVMLCEYKDEDGIRAHFKKAVGKYKNLSSGHKKSGISVIGSGVSYYGLDLIEKYRAGELKRVFLCEGEKKGMVGNYCMKAMFVTLPGVGVYRQLQVRDFGLPSAFEFLRSIGVTEIAVANDIDMKTNMNVQKATIETFKLIQSEGFVPYFVDWDEACGKGIDDCLLTGVKPRIRKIRL